MELSKITSQGQVTIPAAVRKQFGLSAGATIEWQEEGGKLVVKRRGVVSFADMHKKLFPSGAPPKSELTKNQMLAAHFQAKSSR